jgi:hypothetical protein
MRLPITSSWHVFIIYNNIIKIQNSIGIVLKIQNSIGIVLKIQNSIGFILDKIM